VFETFPFVGYILQQIMITRAKRIFWNFRRKSV